MIATGQIADPPRGWLLYDASCGICGSLVLRWETILRKAGYGIAPLQADWVSRLFHMREAELVQDVRLLLPDGTRLQGADVYRSAMRHIWWAYPLYLLSVLPVARTLFNWAYRTFASHRHSLSRSCSLPSR